MLQKTSTFKHAHEYCPRCKTHKHTLHDEHHGEVFCNKCGLVIKDPTANTISRYIEINRYNEKRLYRLHYRDYSSA